MPNSRIAREKSTVSKMIRLYCRKYHQNGSICDSCKKLHDYAIGRLEKCRFGEEKPVCGKCPVHCYKPEMRKEIKEVMRKTGPWMIIHHPWDAFLHLLYKLKGNPEWPVSKQKAN